MLVEVCFHSTDRGLEQIDIEVKFPERMNLSLSCESGKGEIFDEEKEVELFPFSRFWSLLRPCLEAGSKPIFSRKVELILIEQNGSKREFFHREINRPDLEMLRKTLRKETKSIF